MAKASGKSAQPGRMSREEKLKLLKKHKLYSGSTKIEKGKASGAQKRALAKLGKFVPGIKEGTVKVLDTTKVPKGKRPNYMPHTKNKVLVQVQDKSERPYLNKKTGEVSVVLRGHGKKYRQVFYNPTMDLGKLPTGKDLRYQVQFNHWGSDSTRFERIEDMAAYMHPYEVRQKNPWKDWPLYVSVLQIVHPTNHDDYDEDE